MRFPLPSARSPFRTLIERAVYALVAVLIFRTWCIEGLFVPIQVCGGSMATTLLGVHRNVVCADCGFRFDCGTDCPRVGSKAVCPNCGYAENDLAKLPDLAGDRVLIDRSVFRVRRPQRWEIAAFRRPDDAHKAYVKRVVGLPGESIEIRDGDVYVDGQVQRKSLAQQRAMAVLVHDSACRPRSDPPLPPRWQGELADTKWGSAESLFAHPHTRDKRSIDWLLYRHWQRGPNGNGDVEEVPITDRGGYNQMRPVRDDEISPVTDLMLSMMLVETMGEGRLIIRMTDGPEQFEVHIASPQNQWEVLRDGRPIPGASGKLPPWTGRLKLEVSLFDKQFLLAIDGREVVVRAYDPSEPPAEPPPHPIGIGVQGLGVTIRDIQVFRDVYYTRPIGIAARWGFDRPYELPDDQYFVLGDNSLVSDDSRSWPEDPAIGSNLFLGRPLLVHFPARHVAIGDWAFQVPDPTRIRYIR